MVSDQLRQLLLEHDCVTLPGFGGLIAETVTARIHPVRHTLAPPSRRLAFNEKLRHDDGLLTEAVRRALRLPDPEPARQRVRAFTEELRATLRQHRVAELQGLGTLRQQAETMPIHFEPEEGGFLPLTASFGLPELVSRPVLNEVVRAVRTSSAGTSQAQPQLRPVGARVRRLLGTGAEPFYRLATAAIVALSLSATYLNLRLTYSDADGIMGPAVAATEVTARQPQRASVTDAFSREDDVAEPVATIAPSAPALKVETPTPVAAPETSLPTKAVEAKPVAKVLPKPTTPAAVATPNHVVGQATGRYYLVWNAFSSQKKAEKGCREATKLVPGGAEPVVLKPQKGSSLYRVSVADFGSAEEAAAALGTLRPRYKSALWVLRY